jgi:uncharacterized membrane protein
MSCTAATPVVTKGLLGLFTILTATLGSASWMLAVLAGVFVARLHLRSFERSVRQLLEADGKRATLGARAPRFLVTMALLYLLQRVRLPWSGVAVGVFLGLVWGRIVLVQRMPAGQALPAVSPGERA